MVAVSSGLFCLVYGFSNAAAPSWHAPSTYGFLAAGVVLLALFAFWPGRAAGSQPNDSELRPKCYQLFIDK